MRGLRNRLWAVVIHIPFPRLFFEIAWKVTIGAWDAIRLMRVGMYLRALLEASMGIPRAWRIRNPLSSEGLRRYDALRLRPVISPAEFEQPPAVRFAALSAFLRRWKNRPRNRSVWDRKGGDVGTAYTVAYAHEQRHKNELSSAGEKH
jgi:hypothetical protein